MGFRMSQEVGEPSGSSMVEKAIHITEVTDKEGVLKVLNWALDIREGER